MRLLFVMIVLALCGCKNDVTTRKTEYVPVLPAGKCDCCKDAK